MSLLEALTKVGIRTTKVKGKPSEGSHLFAEKTSLFGHSKLQ